MGQSEPRRPGPDTPAGVTRIDVPAEPSVAANRRWWDAEADGYQREHGAFLGDADFVWGPEGLREEEAGLLGPVAGRSVLEIGCGAAQCARWVSANGGHAVGIDVSGVQLAHAARLNRTAGIDVPLALADARRLPFADGTFDLACSAYGALPFVADGDAVVAEVARVLRPGGRFVFSVTHPMRWCFPDDPGEDGLVVRDSYFDRRPYVEVDAAGTPLYAEHHRTIGDRVRDVVAAGLELVDVVEPEWPEALDAVWGGWSRLRGRFIPGTAIFVCDKPA